MLDRLKKSARHFRREIRTYQLVLKDKRTPLAPKLLLYSAVGYAMMPFDLIPDFIPVIGWLDDVILVAGLVALAKKMIPPQIIQDCRAIASCPANEAAGVKS